MVRCALVILAAVLAVADCGGDDSVDQLVAVSMQGQWGAAGTASGGASALAVSAGGGDSGSSSSSSAQATILKSAKRGVAYDLAEPGDLKVLSAGVSWWYSWGLQPSGTVPAGYRAQFQMDFYPMIWGINYDVGAIEDYLLANPQIKYLLVMNEPNLTSQANLTPQQAASLWPDFEAISATTGVKLVGPALTWGTMPGYSDPIVWLDAFYAAYEAANDNRAPQIDYLAFHWHDFGLAQQLDRLAKYGKPFWVTELANWHALQDGAQVDTLAKRQAQIAEMVAICESRADVFRYAWSTGRRSKDVHHTSLLGAAPGELSELGQLYMSLPYTRQ
jgi:hypothetical protein